MHQHIRAPPRSTSSNTSNPANDPERMNSNRDQPLQRARSSVDLASYTERAAAAEASRAATGSSLQQEKDHTKLNQIIQVRIDELWWSLMVDRKADGRFAEFPHKSCISSMLCAGESASGIQQGWRLEAEQMGKSFPFFGVEGGSCHFFLAVVSSPGTRDENRR
jgi:hypothetical protein